MKKNGFTLVELSIVLIIIGLIVGAITAGSSLISSAKVKRLTTDMTTAATAHFMFMEKFDAVPGDMKNATDYWPVATYSFVNNGNGDGIINQNGTPYVEYKYAAEHIGLSGFLNRHTTENVANLSQCHECTASNRCRILFEGNPDENRVYNSIEAIYWHPSLGGKTEGVVNPAEAKSIDTKLDDGMPTTGKFLSHTVEVPISTCHASGEYTVTNSLNECYVELRTQ